MGHSANFNPLQSILHPVTRGILLKPVKDDLISIFRPYGSQCIHSEYIQIYSMAFITYLMHLMIFSAYTIGA